MMRLFIYLNLFFTFVLFSPSNIQYTRLGIGKTAHIQYIVELKSEIAVACALPLKLKRFVLYTGFFFFDKCPIYWYSFAFSTLKSSTR